VVDIAVFVDCLADVLSYLLNLKMIVCQTFKQVFVRVAMTLNIAEVHLDFRV
jgi:amino acid permease